MSILYDEIASYIIRDLKCYSSYYDENTFNEFKSIFESLPVKIENSRKENRALKIGIVGEVKAGKSSFLNSLLFSGNDILPKASTPMTAALTKLSYAEKPSARIVFYSKKEWQFVDDMARSYDKRVAELCEEFRQKRNKLNRSSKIKDALKIRNHNNLTDEEILPLIKDNISDKLISCNELRNLYLKSTENLDNYLGQKVTISLEDINQNLNDYIGAEGKFTAIVKHVEIKINNPILLDFEVVDTPGLNDPILSRSEATKKFLGECDVVFLLSYTGQFLKQEDISFMCNTIPREGIKEVVIVGSKYDSGLLDDNKSNSLKTARNNTIRSYNNQAKNNLERVLNKGSLYTNSIQRLYDSLPPIYISSLLYSAAIRKKRGLSYTDEQNLIISNLKKRFDDFVDSKEILVKLSGIKDIQDNKLNILKLSKNTIIEEKNKNILDSNKLNLLECLDDILNQATLNKNILEKSDKVALDKKKDTILNNLNAMRREISSVIYSTASDVHNSLVNLSTEIDSLVNKHNKFSVEEKTKTENYIKKSGLFGWVKKTEEREIYHYEVSTSEVADNINNYIVSCKTLANDILKKAIDRDELKIKLKNVILSGFDTTEDNFDENEILTPLNRLLKDIQIVQLKIDTEFYKNKVFEEFPNGLAMDSDIHKLKIHQSLILGQVSTYLKNEIDKYDENSQNDLKTLAHTFVERLESKLQDNIKKIESQIENKTEALENYKVLINNISRYKMEIKDMEL
ncbi:dynamin family protein [Veillonella atypica]|jgi:hypothetical protein|uniref:Dynamin family protein n=1 Tax=Veillonella atypica TaxID=39777 RepID=A0AAJ1Q9T1_9FIRM|nr:dynamin family protein [Veillonella atypica]MDK7357814.1 dynamin family protein [Veillonella atypica]